MHGDGSNTGSSRRGGKRLFAAAFLILVAVVLLLAVWVRHNLYASRISPVVLRPEEQETLEVKMALLRSEGPADGQPLPGTTAAAEPYTEDGAVREIHLTERELNALIANRPDIAEMVAVDLADDLISVQLILPVEEDVPLLGGKRLRVHMGLAVTSTDGTPVFALKGISVGGIPLPNAWLGNMKNVNLVERFGTDHGFWKTFSEGIRSIKVREGYLQVRLKE